jgi:hypothetical protein
MLVNKPATYVGDYRNMNTSLSLVNVPIVASVGHNDSISCGVKLMNVHYCSNDFMGIWKIAKFG